MISTQLSANLCIAEKIQFAIHNKLKMWQLRMHCNLRPLDAASVLICFNYDAIPRFKSDNLSFLSCSVFTVDDTLRYAVTLTFDPLTLNFTALQVS